MRTDTTLVSEPVSEPASETVPEYFDLLALPDEILSLVLSSLSHNEKLGARLVNRKIKGLIEQPILWDFPVDSQVMQTLLQASAETILQNIEGLESDENHDSNKLKKDLEVLTGIIATNALASNREDVINRLSNVRSTIIDTLTVKRLLCSLGPHVCCGILGIIASAISAMMIIPPWAEERDLIYHAGCDFGAWLLYKDYDEGNCYSTIPSERDLPHCFAALRDLLSDKLMDSLSIGATIGFLSKIIDNCVYRKILGPKAIQSSLPILNSDTTNIEQSQTKKYAWKAYWNRDKVLMITGVILITILFLNLKKLTSIDMNNNFIITSYDQHPPLITCNIDQNQVQKLVHNKLQMIMALGIPPAFCIAFSLLSILLWAGKGMVIGCRTALGSGARVAHQLEHSLFGNTTEARVAEVDEERADSQTRDMVSMSSSDNESSSSADDDPRAAETRPLLS